MKLRKNENVYESIMLDLHNQGVSFGWVAEVLGLGYWVRLGTFDSCEAVMEAIKKALRS